MTLRGNKRIETWPITKLQPHPRQAELFGDASAEALKKLANDIKRNGLLQAVEILPDGTIICGHQRVRAAALLDWSEITVWVRDDLAEEGPAAVERRLIEDNSNRRQLDPLAVARCALRLKKLASAGRGPRLLPHERADVRDQIGKRLGISGRHLDRLIRVVEHTPAEVQHAVSTNRLALTVALKVAGLRPAQREQVAREIRGGGDPRAVVLRFAPVKGTRHKRAVRALSAFVKGLKAGVADLDGRLDKVGWIPPDQQEAIAEAAEVLQKLQAVIAGQPAERPAVNPELLAKWAQMAEMLPPGR
jgi:hypothetical protein